MQRLSTNRLSLSAIVVAVARGSTTNTSAGALRRHSSTKKAAYEEVRTPIQSQGTWGVRLDAKAFCPFEGGALPTKFLVDGSQPSGCEIRVARPAPKLADKRAELVLNHLVGP